MASGNDLISQIVGRTQSITHSFGATQTDNTPQPTTNGAPTTAPDSSSPAPAPIKPTAPVKPVPSGPSNFFQRIVQQGVNEVRGVSATARMEAATLTKNPTAFRNANQSARANESTTNQFVANKTVPNNPNQRVQINDPVWQVLNNTGKQLLSSTGKIATIIPNEVKSVFNFAVGNKTAGRKAFAQAGEGLNQAKQFAQFFPRSILGLGESVDPWGHTITPKNNPIAHAIFGDTPIPTVHDVYVNTKKTQGTGAAVATATLTFIGYVLGTKGVLDVAAKGVNAPTEKTVQQDVTVPNAQAREFAVQGNKNIDPQTQTILEKALADNPKEFGKSVLKGEDIKSTVDVTKPTVYGKLLDIINGKIKANQPVTPSEAAVVYDASANPDKYTGTTALTKTTPGVKPTEAAPVIAPKPAPSEKPVATPVEKPVAKPNPLKPSTKSDVNLTYPESKNLPSSLQERMPAGKETNKLTPTETQRVTQQTMGWDRGKVKDLINNVPGLKDNPVLTAHVTSEGVQLQAKIGVHEFSIPAKSLGLTEDRIQAAGIKEGTKVNIGDALTTKGKIPAIQKGKAYFSGTTGTSTSKPKVAPEPTPEPKTPAPKNVQDLIQKHKSSVAFGGNIERSANAVEGKKTIIANDAAQLIKDRKPISNSDKALLLEYRDRREAGLPTKPLPSHLQEENSAATALNVESTKANAELARLQGQERKAQTIEDTSNPATYTHRIAREKGSAIDYVLQGDKKNPLGVSGYSKTTPSSKGRVYKSLTDQMGNRTTVAISSVGGARHFIDVKTGADLGLIRPKLPPKATEFIDPKLMENLNQVATDLGITHVRTNVPLNRGDNAAGVYYGGTNFLKTRVGSAPDTLLHEIGHQIDEKYNLQDYMFSGDKGSKSAKIYDAQIKKAQAEGRTTDVRTLQEQKTISTELRALADERVGNFSNKSFSKYVRSGEEKMAVMFQAYLHAPEIFQEVAPTAYNKFVKFLGSHPETKPLLNIDKSLQMAKNVVGEDNIPGVFKSKSGQKFKIGEATTKEITRDAGTKYYTDPFLTSLHNYVETRTALENARFIESIKTSPEFKVFASSPGQTAPKGWKVVPDFPQFQGFKFEPHVADSLNAIIQSPANEGNVLNLTGRFLRQAIVFFPVKHDLHIISAYVIDRKISEYAPAGLVRGASSIIQAMNDRKNFGPMTQKLLENGYNLLSVDSRVYSEAFNKQMQSLIDDQTALESVAKRMGTSAKGLAGVYSKIQHTLIWEVQDTLNMARIIERQKPTLFGKGMSFEQALKQTEKYSYQYRVPSRVAGSTQVSQALQSDLVYFGRFRYDQFKIIGNALKDAVGIDNASQAYEAWNKLILIAIGTTMLMPAINKILQKVTGDKNAHITAPGPMQIPELMYNIFHTHNQSIWKAIANQLYISQGYDLALQLSQNRDSFTGKVIFDPNASPAEKAKQIEKWILSQVGPTQKINSLKNTSGNTVLNGFLSLSGVSFPKTSPGEQKLYSLTYDTLPIRQAKVKQQIQAGDYQGAIQTIKDYNQQLLQAAKDDLKSSGQPIPSDGVLIARLRLKRMWYSPPSANTIQKDQNPSSQSLSGYLSSGKQ